MTAGNGSAHPAATKKFTPRLIFWEVTKGCNLRCIHCRATATELMSPQDLHTDKALNIISQIADYGNPILVLSGGELASRGEGNGWHECAPVMSKAGSVVPGPAASEAGPGHLKSSNPA